MKKSILILLCIFILTLLSCEKRYSYYINGNTAQQMELRKLFNFLEEEMENPEKRYENRFIIIQHIIKEMLNAQNKGKLNLLLSKYAGQNPEDPFNAYYLLIIAQNYKEKEAYPFATHYFERILKNYPELIVRDESVHFICLRNLIRMVDDPEVKIIYYKEILSRYSDKIKLAPTYFSLAKAYENIGEWELALNAYKQTLNYPEQSIPGFPNARKDVEKMIAFNNSRHNWTYENLDTLVSKIKRSIYNRNSRSLASYRAKVNFFALAWEQKEAKADSQFLTQIHTFMRSRIRFSTKLDENSNEKEAYLKTWGWSYRIRTWYLYFRRIHFPADPERHGQWEWAGIYFGEKPFTGASKN